MREEFDVDHIRSVEFCVNLHVGAGNGTSYLVPADQSVQDALTEVLKVTIAAPDPETPDWTPYELSEKYAAQETLRTDLHSEPMASIRTLYEDEGWDLNTTALADPSNLSYYFGVFRDDRERKLLGVRQATQFKGAFKGRFLSVIDDTLHMVADRVFKLDSRFDFLVTERHVYIFHPAGFERVAGIEQFAAARARETTLALGETVKFLEFGGLADYVAKHKRAAKLVAALKGRGDLDTIDRALFVAAARDTGVQLDETGDKLLPMKGSEMGCLELLDHRRYTTTLRPGPKPAFIATSRRPI